MDNENDILRRVLLAGFGGAADPREFENVELSPPMLDIASTITNPDIENILRNHGYR